jgi:hypothetical protein
MGEPFRNEESMSRLYTPLLTLTLLAGIVAASACSQAPRDPETRFIPPAAPLADATPPAAIPAPAQGDAVAAAHPKADDDTPSADDVKEFSRKVPK